MKTFLLKIHFKDGSPSLFLKGPRSPKEVKRLGYGFTNDEAQAWPFPSHKQAENKGRVLYIHMGHGSGDPEECSFAAKCFMVCEVVEKGGAA